MKLTENVSGRPTMWRYPSQSGRDVGKLRSGKDSYPEVNAESGHTKLAVTMDYKIGPYGGRSRRLYRKTCVQCGKEFWRPPHVLEKSRYCSKDCASDGHRKPRIQGVCAVCRASIARRPSQTTKSGLWFCSLRCHSYAQKSESGIVAVHPPHYGTGQTTYRRRAIDHYGAICQVCGYCEYEKMLDVDHIDGNRKNNKITNLAVLCVWCHTLKTRGISSSKRLGL